MNYYLIQMKMTDKHQYFLTVTAKYLIVEKLMTSIKNQVTGDLWFNNEESTNEVQDSLQTYMAMIFSETKKELSDIIDYEWAENLILQNGRNKAKGKLSPLGPLSLRPAPLDIIHENSQENTASFENESQNNIQEE